MAKPRYKSVTIRPSSGGTLAPALSEDLSQNPANYEVKLNFRREHDYEVRREGWELYKPFEDVNFVPTDFPENWTESKVKDLKRRLRGQCLASADPVEAIEQFESGRRITVAATPTSAYVQNPQLRNSLANSLRYLEAVISGYTNDDTDKPYHFDIASGKQQPGVGFYFENYSEASDNYVWSDRNDPDEVLADVDGWANVTPEEYSASRLSGRYMILSAKNINDLTEAETNELEALEVLAADSRGFHAGDSMEIEHLAGFAMFNNGRELPAVYHSDFEKAHPIYELRELGIVCAKTIAQFGGYLLLADVTEFSEGGLEAWSDLCKQPDGPGFYESVLDSIPYKAGQVDVVTTKYRIMYSNPGAPMRWGFIAKSDGDLPYSPDGSTSWGLNTTKFKIPFPLETRSGIRRLNGTFSKGTRVWVDLLHSNGSVSNSILATVLDVDPITRIYTLDKTIAWDGGNDQIDLSSGVTGTLRRANNFNETPNIFNSVADYIDPIKDGSRIIKMQTLRDRLVVFREKGYALMSMVEVVYDPDTSRPVNAPFSYETRYTGSRVPMHKHASVVVNDQRILYAGREDIYSISASYSEPSIPIAIDFAKEFGYGDTVSLTDNVLTGEIFICGTKKTLAFDYKYDTLSEIDAVFSSGKSIKHPVTGLDIFLLCTRAKLELPGLENPVGGYFPRSHALFKYSYDVPSNQEHNELGNVPQVFDPDGRRGFYRQEATGGEIVSSTYDSIIESGWIDFSKRLDEKDFRMYLIDFHSEPSNFYLRKSSSVGGTSRAYLPFKLPLLLPARQFSTFTEDRLALSDHQEYEVDQAPQHRLLTEQPFLVNVTLLSKDTMGGVSRIEIDVDLTATDELSIPTWFRSILVKDRITMKGLDAGKVYSRSFEASLVGSGGRTISIRR